MTVSSLTLTELNQQIQQTLKRSMGASFWVRAEISELRDNANGHCYMELIEKDVVTDQIKARLKATIWASTYRMLKPYFLQSTGTSLQSGMKVLVCGTVGFHELYGLSFTITDIDPAFTVGDMAMRRAEIIRQLTEDGVIDMNGELEFPLLPRRIAVISSATAAGYGDFCDQLLHNSYGYYFYVKLFPALMQGAKTEDSVIEALNAIYEHIELFDCVVIIRGGGATAELATFDSYEMALHVAQFPLPVISGIGHQRDATIIDLVAHSCVKTPTAAAELLINKIHGTEENLDYLTERLVSSAQGRLELESRNLQAVVMRLPLLLSGRMAHETHGLDSLLLQLKRLTERRLDAEKHRLTLLEHSIQMADPEQMLKRGYSITTCNGIPIRSLHELQMGSSLVTYFMDGTVESTIDKIKSKPQ